MSVKLKVCGITSFDDACAAVEAGAQYLGFNFYPKSPRCITPEAARVIIESLPGDIISVGIFVNESSPGDVIELMNAAGVRMAQLHGDEDPAYCEKVGAHRVIKALRVGDDFKANRVTEYPSAAILIDAYDKNLYGGTGKTADWRAAREAAKSVKIFLAGGISPENIVEAVRAVEPFAVDVNSGVESAPGRKDAGRLRKLKEEIEKLK